MNPYEVLGVSENADEETIKKALSAQAETIQRVNTQSAVQSIRLLKVWISMLKHQQNIAYTLITSAESLRLTKTQYQRTTAY